MVARSLRAYFGFCACTLGPGCCRVGMVVHGAGGIWHIAIFRCHFVRVLEFGGYDGGGGTSLSLRYVYPRAMTIVDDKLKVTWKILPPLSTLAERMLEKRRPLSSFRSAIVERDGRSFHFALNVSVTV